MKELFFKKLTPEDKEKYKQICTEVVVLLRDKHKLNQYECAYILDVLMKALQSIYSGLDIRSG